MSSQWRIIAESVIGHSHIRKNLPNQDQGGIKRKYGGYPLVAAVADGHGGKIYFRSDRGSDIAVNSAITVISYYYDQEPTLSDSKIVEFICKDIFKEWRSRVLEDIKKNPYSAEELLFMEEGKAGRKFNTPIDPDYELIRPYGSTVLASIITEDYATFFQLGDGDIIIHMPDGRFVRPIPSDKNLAGNETYSLCMPESWRDFIVQRIDEIPDFVMLCTDGYANSFVDESGFIAAAHDIYSYIFSAENFDTGIELVQTNLRGWLSTASEKGSGDDITTLLLVHDPKGGTRSPRKLSDDDIVFLNQVPSSPLSYDFLKPERPKVVSQKVPDTIKERSGTIPIPEPVPCPVPASSPIKPQKEGLKTSKKIAIILFLLLITGITMMLVLPGLDNKTSTDRVDSAQFSDGYGLKLSVKALHNISFTKPPTKLSNVTDLVWNFGDLNSYSGNISDPQATSPNHSYQHPGFYKVYLTVINDTRKIDTSLVADVNVT